MSYSVRFYIDGKKASSGLEEITNFVQNLGKFSDFSEEENYYEFRVEAHLMAHPNEYISFEFQQKIKPFLTKVTMVTKNYGRYGIEGGDTRVPVLVGSSMISLEQNSVMIVGQNFNLMVKAYLLFCKHNGCMPDYHEAQSKQKNLEFQKKYKDVSNSLIDCKLELGFAKEKISQLEKQLEEKNNVPYKNNIFVDALAFIFNEDARTLSDHKYPNGFFMSVREAKKRHLM